jgi:hypothetical protein
MGQWEINNNNPSNPFDQNSKHFWVNGKKSCIFSQQPHKKLNSRSMQRTTFLFKEKISCSTFHGPLGKNFFDSSHFSSISRLR